MTMRHDVFLIPRLLIFSYKHTPAPSEAGNTSAEGRPQPSHSSLSLCPYGVRAARADGAQAGCHCHNRSGKGVPSADFAGYILRAVAVRLGSPQI